MKHVKITSPKQLRQLIIETFQDQKNVQESESALANELPGRLADLVQEYFEEQYDDGDPSMVAAGGQPAWNLQCASAASEFAVAVNKLVQQIEMKLVDGAYHK